MLRNKFLLILLLAFIGSAGLRAQDCDCYKTTRAQGVKLMQQKKYAKAIEFFNAAEDCPDKPANHDLASKREECRKAIQQAEEARRQEEEAARLRREAELRRQQEEAARLQREAEQRRQQEEAERRRREEEEKTRQTKSEWANKAYMDITYISFSNQGYDGDIINDYGSALYAEDMRYLGPKVKYEGKCSTSQSVELYWKIYKPDGTLDRNSSHSPEGYTSHSTYTIYPGTNELKLLGWGSKTGGTYSPGSYRYELWYNGNRLWTAYVNLLSRNTRTATIQEVTVDHNVYENNVKGMKIHVKFNIQGCKGESCRAIAYFYYADGSPVKDTNGLYHDTAGNVSVGKDFNPGYDDTIYNDLVIFMPNSEIHSTTRTGTVSFYFQVELYNLTSKEFIGNKYKINFTITY